MLRVDGAYLYNLGSNLRMIPQLDSKEYNIAEVALILNPAKSALKTFLYDSIFSEGVRTLLVPARSLLSKLDDVAPDFNPSVDWSRNIQAWQISIIKTEFEKFEAVLTAILQTANLYYVSAKGGFDTASLTDNGDAIFPKDLAAKVPDAIPDIKAGARCLAFELPTAAGFHFHRANEAVLRVYFDSVAGSENRPKSRNMGDYINAMKTKQVGDTRVLDVLKSLKDLHRNPLMHPEDSILTIDEAISLYSAIRAAIGYMLDRISADPSPVISPLPFEPTKETVENGPTRTAPPQKAQP